MSEQTNDTETAALAPIRQAQGMVLNYANALLNKELAKKFVTQMAVMGKSNWKLAQSTPESLATALLACVHLNLMPNTPAGLAYIIPYKNNRTGKFEAQFQISYKGLVQLSYRSGIVSSINAELVFPEDTFEVDLGSRVIKHIPDFTIDRTDWGKATACYAVAKLPSGGIVFDVMSRSEIDKVRKSVKFLTDDSPWKTWESEMVKKTPVKRLAKLLPSSSEDNLLAMAAAWDSAAQAGKLRAIDGEIVAEELNVEPLSDEAKAQIAAEAKDTAARLKAGAQDEANQESEGDQE